MDDIRASIPDELYASRGKHNSPTHGTCLMELASVLAGETFTDRPTCIHPALATLARLVNDQVGDAVRQRLVPLLPDMMSGPHDDPATGLAVAVTCLDTVLARTPNRRLRRFHARARRQLGRLDTSQRRFWLGDLNRRMTASRAIRAAVWDARYLGQRVLADMLIDATTAYHASVVAAAHAPTARPTRAPACVAG